MNTFAELHIVHTPFFAALSLDFYSHLDDVDTIVAFQVDTIVAFQVDTNVVFQNEIVVALGYVNDYRGRVVIKFLSSRGILYAYEETFKSSITPR